MTERRAMLLQAVRRSRIRRDMAACQQALERVHERGEWAAGRVVDLSNWASRGRWRNGDGWVNLPAHVPGEPDTSMIDLDAVFFGA